MAISQLYSSSKSPRGTSSKSKALEIRKKLLCNKSSPLKAKTKKVIYNALKNATSKDKEAPPIKQCLSLVDTNNSAMKRAEEVQANLQSKFPSCIKLMLLSHVTGGFWLSLPRSFCNIHMPKEGEHKIILVNENGGEYETKYLSRKNGLSGGWRGFSIAHDLVEGDVLVFHLIQPFKFKVYIVRANNLTELDGAIGLLTLDNNARSCSENDQTRNATENFEDEEDGYFDHQIPLKACNIDGKDKGQNGDESDDVVSELLEGIKFADYISDFEKIKSIDSFAIHVDGLVIDSEIPPHLRVKYYDLCCSQNTFLHKNLLMGLNLSLVSGVISETVNIADAIRATKFTNAKDNLMIWDQTLEGFEKFGMNVAFLRARIERLVRLAFEPENVLKNKKMEREKADEGMRMLEQRLLKVRRGMKVLDSEIEGLMEENGRIEGLFKKEANASW